MPLPNISTVLRFQIVTASSDNHKDLRTKRRIDGGIEKDGLYYLTDFNASAMKAYSVSPLNWHHRLGHLSPSRLRYILGFLLEPLRHEESPDKVPVLSSFKTLKFGNGRCPQISAAKTCRNHNFLVRSLVGDSNDPVQVDVPFPSDYSELLLQAKKATELALEDEKQLMEIEFPTAGLESVPGDGEGGTEMTESMLLIRQFCDCFIKPEKASRTRIFFPEASEVEFARKSAFDGASFKLDYLTKPSIFEDFGFVSKVKMADRVKPEDEFFLVAYPYFNVNEMLVVEELYREAVENTARKLLVFNGEIDRIRSGYYPSFFYPKLAGLAKTFLPKMETVYYIHNFKGRNGGNLFRCYPGPWKVMRKVNDKHVCLHEQEVMPSLKEVALEILPSA